MVCSFRPEILVGECGTSVLDYESLYINLVGALIYNIRRSTYTKIPALFALESGELEWIL